MKSTILRPIWPRVTQYPERNRTVICVDGRPTHGRKYFKDTDEALVYAQELSQHRRDPKEEPLFVSSRLRVVAADGEKSLREKGSSLKEAVEFYLEHLERVEKEGPGITMWDAYAQYMAARLKQFKEGQIRSVTYHGTLHRQKRDQEYFNKTLVKDITPRQSLGLYRAQKKQLYHQKEHQNPAQPLLYLLPLAWLD